MIEGFFLCQTEVFKSDVILTTLSKHYESSCYVIYLEVNNFKISGYFITLKKKHIKIHNYYDIV